MPEPRYVLSERAATALRALISPGSGYSSRQRRIGNVGSYAGAGMQWRIATAAVVPTEAAQIPQVSVSVGAGLVAWGAGVTFSNPGEPDLGELRPGESARIVWATSATPIPLVNDPRWPGGNAPKCGCCEGSGGNCHRDNGDPDGTGGDSGILVLVPMDWNAPSGTTDCREIGVVEVSEAGVATVTQFQRDTIVARAIVGRSDPGGDEPENPPPCGNPLNDSSDYNPLDHVPIASGDRNPLDDPGPGGYTPTCRDEGAQAA